MVAPGGACVVALGGHARLLGGGMCGCSQRGCVWLLLGACVVAPGGRVWDMTRYGDTVNERAVRILLECILVATKFAASTKSVCSAVLH